MHDESLITEIDTALTLANLTPRERQVAQLMPVGLSRDEIAQRLGCAHQTVDNHLTSIYRKTGIRTAAGLAGWVMRQTEQRRIYQLLKDRIWSMPASYHGGMRYVSLSGVSKILADVLRER